MVRVPVLRVFDGDGFLTRVRIGGREIEASVRFGFIDAPEMGQPGGREARDFLKSLIEDQWVDLALLLKMDTGRIVDGYGRIVAVPYMQTYFSQHAGSASILGQLFGALAAQTYRNIELEMVLNGWAWVLERYEPDARYFEALDDARQHRRGIWARDDNLHPWEFKKRRHAHRRRNGDHRQLLVDDSGVTQCPRQGCCGRLVKRNGRYGEFFGCSGFPICRYSCKHPG